MRNTQRTCAGPCGGSIIGDCSGGCPEPYAYPREALGFGCGCAYGLFAAAEVRLCGGDCSATFSVAGR